MNKKTTRIIALALVVVMILALVASMIVPYMYKEHIEKQMDGWGRPFPFCDGIYEWPAL